MYVIDMYHDRTSQKDNVSCQICQNYIEGSIKVNGIVLVEVLVEDDLLPLSGSTLTIQECF